MVESQGTSILAVLPQGPRADDGQIMPWDSDIDVQVSLDTMDFLAAYYNMTIHTYKDKGMPRGRNYLLEINPGYTNGSRSDKLNVIDARWIDVESGVFIDLTVVRHKKGDPGTMDCKDTHEYLVGFLPPEISIARPPDRVRSQEQDLFPLRDSIFEGRRVKIPYNYGPHPAPLLQDDPLTRAQSGCWKRNTAGNR